MKYNLSIKSDQNKFTIKAEYLKANGKEVELKAIKQTRTNKQNSALHLFFDFVSDELNELGLQYQYQGLTGKTFEMMYTAHLVKEFIWKPIQKSLFDIETTTKLTTEQMNKVIDVITNFFSSQGVVLAFPSIESLIDNV